MRAFGKNPTTNSGVFAFHANSLQEAAVKLSVSTKRFSVLIACDSGSTSENEIGDFAATLMEQGAVYVCCWGKGCERFHDIVDEVWVIREINGKYGAVAKDSTLMTTWHDKESLDEALWFLLFAASPPDADSETYSNLVITIGDQSLLDALSCRLANIPKFNAEMANRD